MARKPKAALTPNQELFISAYLETGNAKHAEGISGIVLRGKVPSGKYVYFLVSTDGTSILYVGKGVGTRMFHHVRDARKGRISGLRKHKVIEHLLRDGKAPRAVVFAVCPDDASAVCLERTLIARLWESGICNGSAGIRTADEIELARIDHAISGVKPFCRWIEERQPSESDVALYWNVVGELSKMKADPMYRLRELTWCEHG